MKTALPPGPKMPRLIQAARFVMNPHGFIERCHERYGDIFTLRLSGRPPAVVVSQPEAVRWLVTAGYDATERFAEEARYLLGDRALLLQQDEAHRQARKGMHAPFHGERMRAYGLEMAAVADERIRGWRVGQQFALTREMEKISLDVILRCVFGISEEPRIRKMAALILEYLEAMLSPLMFGATLVVGGRRVRDFVRAGIGRARGFRPRRIHRISQVLGAIEQILTEEIGRRRRHPGSDILSLLVGIRFDDGSTMSDETLRDHLFMLLLAAYETTAATLAWTVYCLQRHPATLVRLRAELDTVMGDGFDPSRVKELAYMSAVLNEAMRLCPIATLVSRQLKKETELAGHRLPAGTIVSPCIYLAQRDPRTWVAPTQFRPERFIGGRASVYHFFPFGAGMWRCVGAQFAEYEMRVVLARLVAQVDLELVDEQRVRPVQHGIIVAPSDGLPVRVRRSVAEEREAGEAKHALKEAV
jgi:cytochrome P450